MSISAENPVQLLIIKIRQESTVCRWFYQKTWSWYACVFKISHQVSWI